jgi:hypothetical protein
MVKPISQFVDNCCLELQETSVNFAEIEKLLSRLTQHIVDVSLTFRRKIYLPVASRLAIVLVNYNVKCCYCLFYKFSPLSDNNNKIHNYNSHV